MSDVETTADAGQTETPAQAPKRKGGRPRKARGAANTSDAADSRWTVRGVPSNVRDMAVKAAERKGATVGDWVAEAIVRAVRADEKGVSADGSAGLPAATVADTLKALNERLTKLEADKGKGLLGRLFGGRSAVVALMVLGLLGGVVRAAEPTKRASEHVFQDGVFVTGQMYRGMDVGFQRMYVAGVYDAYAALAEYGWLVPCSTGLHSGKMAEVVMAYLGEHPQQLDSAAARLTVQAIANVCPSAPAAFKR